MIFDMLPYFPKNSYDTPWFTFIADSLSWTLSVFSSLTLILWVFITISWSFGTFSGHNWPGALITGPFNGWVTLQQTSHCDDMNTPTQKTLVLEAVPINWRHKNLKLRLFGFIQLIANMSGIDMYAMLVYHTTWASHLIIPCARLTYGVRIFSVTMYITTQHCLNCHTLHCFTRQVQ